jgi:SAM-dependent methyltransferase
LERQDAELSRSWRINAGLWSDAVRDGRIASRKAVTDAAILSAVLRQQPSGVLDLGCGEGWLCRALEPHVSRRVGVDASPELIALATAAGGADFMVLSYDQLIERPAAVGIGFDVVVANFSLLDDQTERVLAAAREVARPGGKLIIQTVHPLSAGGAYRDGWRTEDFKSFGSESWAPMPWFFRTLGSWSSVLGDAWTILSIEEPAVEGAQPASLLLAARA